MHRRAERFRAAALDLDGTLIDSAPDLCLAANAMLQELGGAHLPEHELRGLIGGGIDRLVDRTLQQGLGDAASDAGLAAHARALFAQLYGEHLFDRSRVYPGVRETLYQFASAGIVLCCVTNKESRFALPLLEAARLDTSLAFTLCADRATDRKPSPTLLLNACARLRIEPADLLYVGDAHTDVVAARAAGCRIVTVDYGYGDPHALAQARPDGRIGDLRELLLVYMDPLARRPPDLTLLTE